MIFTNPYFLFILIPVLLVVSVLGAYNYQYWYEIIITDYLQPSKINNHDGSPYKYTEQVIDDTFLGKTVSQWQKESFGSLMFYYNHLYGDEFFDDLGALVVKNDMIHELNKQNIQIVNSELKVHAGIATKSLPPYILFEAFIIDANNITYRLSGETFSAEAIYIKITKVETITKQEQKR